MNQRIKELAVECYNPYTNFDHARFAELIIADVIEIIKDQRNYNAHIYTTHDADRAGGVAQELVKAIKQRLG